MTKKDFYLTTTLSILPALADILEDFEFTQRAKQLQNQVINSIRMQDRFYLDTDNEEIFNQQVDIQRAFRVWLDEAYNEINEEI